MKATISQLWDTGIDIILIDNDEFSNPSFADLRKCDNVLICENNEILIDNDVYTIHRNKFRHPTSGDSVSVLNVIPAIY